VLSFGAALLLLTITSGWTLLSSLLYSTLLYDVESETFDLAGQSSTTIITNIRSAFAEPLPLDEMIRITLVTGAGKLGRQKYDVDAAKCVTSTLREVGYNEDKGASAVLECAGSFKLQHDTGKNLKTVVVFPRVSSAAGVPSPGMNGADGGMQNLAIGGGGGGGSSSLIPESSPDHSIAYSSMTVFERMMASKCQTWTQKKACNNAIGSIMSMVKELEAKLLLGTALTDPEQSLYDGVSMSVLEEKQAFVKAQMQQQVDDEKLTAPEKAILLEQVGERLASLKEEKEAAEKEGKTKRVQQLTNMSTKVEERKAKLEKVTPKTPPPLKHEAEIAKLRKEIEPLLDVEEASKGRLLTLKETQALGRKEELEAQIEQLEVRRSPLRCICRNNLYC
jgi:hypothetical protein